MGLKLFPSQTVIIKSGAGLTDSFTLNIQANDSNNTPTDASTFAIALSQAETNPTPSETATLTFPSGDFGDSNAAPSESRLFHIRSWATGCASNDANLANPGNANGQNDGAFCNVKTNNALGDLTNPVTLTTGSMNWPGSTVISALIRVFFKVPGVTLALADTLFISANSTGGFNQHIWDSPPTTTIGWPGVDFSSEATSFTFNISSLTVTQLNNLQLVGSYSAAVVATPTTMLQIDAWAIDAVVAI
jgi:hypothetical protein